VVLYSRVRPSDELIEAAASAADSGNTSPSRFGCGCCGRLDLVVVVVDRSCLFDTSLSLSRARTQAPPSDWLLTTSGGQRSALVQ